MKPIKCIGLYSLGKALIYHGESLIKAPESGLGLAFPDLSLLVNESGVRFRVMIGHTRVSSPACAIVPAL